MPKCPYCKKELYIEDFFDVQTRETKKGKIKTKIRGFRGEILERGWHSLKMWACPSCDSIMGFSEYRYSSAT